MKQKTEPSAYRRLVLLFRDRFFESDSDAPDSGFTPNLYQIFGMLAAPGLLSSVGLMADFMDLAHMKAGPAVTAALRIQHLFFSAYAFAVVTFATVFEWDTLFPDRRDFLVLGPFPLRVREIFTAKIAALSWFLLLLTLAVCGIPTLLVTILSFDIPQVHENGFLTVCAAQFFSTFGISGFAFIAVAAFQGLLIAVLNPRTFRRVSPWIQVFGMSFAVASLLMYPIYSVLLARLGPAHPQWLWYFPPVWFAGIGDLMLTRGDPFFARLGLLAFEAIGLAAAAFVLLWFIGFQRHYRRTLESEDTSAHRPRASIFDRWLSSPEELAIFRFSGRMLARSAKHRLFLATYWSVGLSIGALFVIGVRNGRLVVSDGGLRSLPFLIQFIVLSGFRAGFQYPADLQANWIFRITENYWSQIARRVGRMRVLVTGLVPIVILFVPISAAYRGAGAAVFDALFQLLAGALLTEILFWRFETVPFTCSYFQGRTNLFLLLAAYVFGISYYCFHLGDLQAGLEHQPLRGIVYLCAGAGLLAISWRRRPAPEAVSFDATEPRIRSLDLT